MNINYKDTTMRTIILIAALLPAALFADTPYFTVGDPTLIVKAFANPDSTDKHDGVMIEAETGVCDKYKNCYNPTVFYVDGVPGAGIDYVFKLFKRPDRDAFRLSVGGAAFYESLNGEDKNVLHAGISAEIYTSKQFGFLVTADYLRTDSPITLFGVGVHFR